MTGHLSCAGPALQTIKTQDIERISFCVFAMPDRVRIVSFRHTGPGSYYSDRAFRRGLAAFRDICPRVAETIRDTGGFNGQDGHRAQDG